MDFAYRLPIVNIPVVQRRIGEGRWVGFARIIIRMLLAFPDKVRMAMDPCHPWLPQGAVRWMRRNLDSGMTCWEWGSGRSTLFIAKRVRALTSVEHKNRWRKTTSAALARHGIHNAHLIFSPSSKSDAGKICTPDGEDYAAYADAIRGVPKESLDFILVDGRARVRCMLNAMDRLRPGGFLLVDNSERPRYGAGLAALDTWETEHFSNGLQRASVFRKPLGEP